MIGILAFLKDRWRALAFDAVLVLVGIAIGYRLRPAPAPAVHQVLDEHLAKQKQSDTEQHADVGGWTATTYYFAKGVPDAVARDSGWSSAGVDRLAGADPLVRPEASGLVEMVVERHDPTVIETHSHAVERVTEDRHLDLTVTPQAAPGWALQVGLEDVLAARTLRLAARRHLFGPLWVELSAMPMQRSLGAAAAVEW